MYKWGLDLQYDTLTGDHYWHWFPLFRTEEVCNAFYDLVFRPILEANLVTHIEYACKVIN